MGQLFLFENEWWGIDQVVNVQETAPGNTKVTFSNNQILLMSTAEAEGIFGKFT